MKCLGTYLSSHTNLYTKIQKTSLKKIKENLSNLKSMPNAMECMP